MLLLPSANRVASGVELERGNVAGLKDSFRALGLGGREQNDLSSKNEKAIRELVGDFNWRDQARQRFNDHIRPAIDAIREHNSQFAAQPDAMPSDADKAKLDWLIATYARDGKAEGLSDLLTPYCRDLVRLAERQGEVADGKSA